MGDENCRIGNELGSGEHAHIQQFKFVINAVPKTADIWSVIKHGMLARMSNAPIYGYRAFIPNLA